MRMLSKGRMAPSLLTCDRCGAEFTVWRSLGRLRPHGHTKHVWCHVCRDVTAHTEEARPWR